MSFSSLSAAQRKRLVFAIHVIQSLSNDGFISFNNDFDPFYLNSSVLTSFDGDDTIANAITTKLNSLFGKTKKNTIAASVPVVNAIVDQFYQNNTDTSAADNTNNEVTAPVADKPKRKYNRKPKNNTDVTTIAAEPSAEPSTEPSAEPSAEVVAPVWNNDNEQPETTSETAPVADKPKRKYIRKPKNNNTDTITIAEPIAESTTDNIAAAEQPAEPAAEPVVAVADKPKRKITKKPKKNTDTAIDTTAEPIAETVATEPVAEPTVAEPVIDTTTTEPTVVEPAAEPAADKPKRKISKKVKKTTDSEPANETASETQPAVESQPAVDNQVPAADKPKRKSNKKNKSTNADANADTASETSADKPKRKYTKKSILNNIANSDDIVSKIVAAGLNESIPTVAPELAAEDYNNTQQEQELPQQEQDEEPEEEIHGRIIIYNGMQYIIDSDNNIYDKDSFDHIGEFIAASQTISFH